MCGHSDTEALGPMASSVAARPFPRTVVLMIGYDAEVQAAYAYALSAFGFDVVMAGDVAEALGRAAKRRPDVILAAVAGSGGDDWQIVAHLRQDPRTSDIPLIATTSRVTAGTLAHAQREGCAAILLTVVPP